VAGGLVASPEEMFGLLEQLRETPEGPDKAALWERVNRELAYREATGQGISVDPIEAARLGPSDNPLLENLQRFFQGSESFFSNISRDPAAIAASGGWQPGFTWRDQQLERWEPMLAAIENPELQEYMRGIAGHFATGLSIPAMIAEPGPGELGLAARELLPMMALVPNLPVGLQKLVAQYLPAELLDPNGMPLRLFHGGKLPAGVGDQVPFSITNSEGHGHWGNFWTPMIENSAEYLRMRDNPGEIYEALVVPDRALRSTRFPGNTFTSSDPNYFRITPVQADEYRELVEELRPIMKKADDLRAAKVNDGIRYFETNLMEDLREFEAAMQTGSPNVDIGEFYRQLNLWTRDVARAFPEALDGSRCLSDLEEFTVARRMDSAGPTPFGAFGRDRYQTPDLSFSDLAVRSGYDAGMGPWTTPKRVNFGVNYNAALVPSEVATYLPNLNTIHPVTPDTVAAFLRGKGVPDDVIQAAMQTDLPQDVIMFGNRAYYKPEIANEVLDAFQASGWKSPTGEPINWLNSPHLRSPRDLYEYLNLATVQKDPGNAIHRVLPELDLMYPKEVTSEFIQQIVDAVFEALPARIGTQ